VSRRRDLAVGDRVRWNSEAGHVTGHIIRIHRRDTQYKGHPRHASADDPQYEIKSDKTDHVAMHTGSVLRRIRAKGAASGLKVRARPRRTHPD
jgi:hypothetical protein